MKTNKVVSVLALTLALALIFAGVGFAQAITETDSLIVPTDVYVYIPCAAGGAGEGVILTGNLHILSHVTLDPNGGYHLLSQFQPQGISGYGLVTGEKYQGTGITRDEENYRGLPYEFTYVNNFRIIGQGTGNNYLVHAITHVTINANGELTAEVDNFSVECK